MSKKSKSQAKDKRRAMKRSRKASQKAQYEAWAREGQNKKSKRVRLAFGRVRAGRARSHPDGDCGNLGCIRCNVHLNDPRSATPSSCLYRKRFMPKAMNAFLKRSS